MAQRIRRSTCRTCWWKSEEPGWVPARRDSWTRSTPPWSRRSRYPLDDKLLRLVAHAPDDFIIPPGRGEKFTRIEITLFNGRSLEAKRKLYTAIVRNLEPFGVPAEDVKIILLEVPPENWGVRGGHAACDIDIGFKVRV